MAEQHIILDNSVNSRLLWPDTETPANNSYALKVIRQAVEGIVLYVPTIWHYEAAQVACNLTKMKRITQADAYNYFSQLALLPIVTDTLSHANVSARTYELGVQYGLSVYDGAYLELALRLGGELATNDVLLAKSAQRAGVPLFPR